MATKALTSVLSWPAAFSIEALLAGVVVAVGTGIFFGYYPAGRAAVLNPIDVLRCK